MKVVVLGGGVIGLSSAWALLRNGHEVVVVDRDRAGGGATPGNAGWVCPSQVGPLAAPGMLRHSAALLLRPTSPLYIPLRLDGELLRFLLAFSRRCTRRAHASGVAALVGLASTVEEDFALLEADLAKVGAPLVRNRTGVLCCFTDERRARTAHEGWASPERSGGPGPGPLLDGEAMRREEEALTGRVAAGFVLAEDSHLDPEAFAGGLRVMVEHLGGTILEHVGECELVRSGDRVSGVQTAAAGALDADEVVVAAGAGSAAYLRALGVRVPMVSGKGYSFTVHPEHKPRRALHLEEAHVACTPMNGGLRVAGTMELSAAPGINPRRVDAIAQAAASYLEGISWTERSDVWGGPRPVTSDGLPLLGRPPGVHGCVVATGHGMYGVTLAATTARFVATLLAGGAAPGQFSPGR